MNDSGKLRSKFLGGMVGSGLGDAIGEMAFHRPDEGRLRAWIEETDLLVYTDDTAMALGLAESLVSTGDLNPQHLGDTFRQNYRRAPWRGYASGPPTVFARVERSDVSYAEAARTLYGGEGSFGNGAAMRIGALGLFFHDAPDLEAQARASASVTHAHPIGLDGAAVQAQAVARATALRPDGPFPAESFGRRLVDVAQTPEMQAKLEQVNDLVARDVPPGAAAAQLGRSVAVHESLPFALYAFLRHPKSFEECLFCAILHGGDRDTLGAMACAVSGAYLGIEAIPADWRAKLENGEQIEALAIQLLEKRGNQP